MDRTSAQPGTRDLARRLLALEAGSDGPRVEGGSLVRVCEKLRQPLTRLAGVEGFRSLLTRALARARTEVPSLQEIRVLPDGSLDGFDAIEPHEDGGAEMVLVAQLLGLLVIFIGEPLMLRLVLDVWPNAVADSDAVRREAR